MNVTDVRVRRITQDGKMRAVVSVTFDGEFVVHDIKVIEGDNGLFIAMPSKKSTDGTYRDVAHPINKEMRQVLQDRILESYQQALLEMPPQTEGQETAE
ncbi:MAG: septation regulator SpoVG [Lachnospiraceae bacterium]|nr:septation regulator SpoVG [Lachnospiraceae bacterium]